MKTVEMTDRGWEILNAVDKFLREYRRWMLEEYNHLDARISDALDEMLKVAQGECPRGFAAMCYWLGEMQKSMDAFDASGEGEVTASHPAMNAADELEAVRNRQDPTPQARIESMQWYEENSNMGQAARAYGLFDVKGNPRTDLAQRELDEPGSVLVKGMVRDDIEDWEKPLPFPAPQSVTSEPKAAPRRSEPEEEACPETLEELFGIDVGDEQIARMKQIDIEAVRVARTTWNSNRARTRAKADMEASQMAFQEKYGEPEEVEETGEYAELDDEQLKEMCREQSIAVRGSPKRATLLAKLKEASKTNV